MPEFKKRPIVVDAMQLTDKNAADVMDWMRSVAGKAEVEVFSEGKRLVISTPDGEMRAEPKDWIIRGLKGEFYPVKPDIFTATYEAVHA